MMTSVLALVRQPPMQWLAANNCFDKYVLYIYGNKPSLK